MILATDADGVYLDWGTEKAKKLHRVTPEEIKDYDFESGSMGPKVEAACEFVNRERPCGWKRRTHTHQPSTNTGIVYKK